MPLVRVQCPQQANGFDCGLFVLAHAEHFIRTQPRRLPPIEDLRELGVRGRGDDMPFLICHSSFLIPYPSSHLILTPPTHAQRRPAKRPPRAPPGLSRAEELALALAHPEVAGYPEFLRPDWFPGGGPGGLPLRRHMREMVLRGLEEVCVCGGGGGTCAHVVCL